MKPVHLMLLPLGPQGGPGARAEPALAWVGELSTAPRPPGREGRGINSPQAWNTAPARHQRWRCGGQVCGHQTGVGALGPQNLITDMSSGLGSEHRAAAQEASSTPAPPQGRGCQDLGLCPNSARPVEILRATKTKAETCLCACGSGGASLPSLCLRFLLCKKAKWSGQPTVWPGAGEQEQRTDGRPSGQQAGSLSRPSVTHYCPGPAPPSRGLSAPVSGNDPANFQWSEAPDPPGHCHSSLHGAVRGSGWT